jgi:quercetin dioxygenase-like cupin family protein
MLKGTTYEESLFLLRLPGGTPDARSRSSRSCRREGTVRADYPGKEGRVIEVSYPPGAQDVVHRHDAHAFVYVLEGQIVMQLKGQPAVTLKAGQTFYEGPTDVHLVRRNASNTEPARFVVVLLKGTGAPILTPVKE